MELIFAMIAIIVVIIGILLWMIDDSKKSNESYGGTEVDDKKGEGP